MTLFLQSAGWALIHFVWQGGAIAAVAAVALRLTERRSANLRYLVACTALTAMLAAPVVTARLLWFASTSPAAAETGLSSSMPAGAARVLTHTVAVDAEEASKPSTMVVAISRGAFPIDRLDRIGPGIAIAWLLGVAMLLARTVGGWWRVRRLHRTALASSSSRWQTACRRIAYRLGLPAAAHVVESALVDVPTVVGWLRPAILLPVAALASLSPAQIEAILAHELAHIRRHDYALNVLQTFAETLLFYHPAIWWLSKRIRIEREHCCDEIAVAMCGDPVSYARALAELETWRTTSASMALAATGGSLLDRVRRILRVPVTDEPRSASWAATLALTMIFTAAAAISQTPSPHTTAAAASASARACSGLGGRRAMPRRGTPQRMLTTSRIRCSTALRGSPAIAL